MILTLALLSLTFQNPPPVMSARSPSQTELDWGISLPPATTPEPVVPTPLETCLTTRFGDAGISDECRPLLEAERDLVPPTAFDLSSSWVFQTCSGDNLQPGQTSLDCRIEARTRLQRARVANDALNGQPLRMIRSSRSVEEPQMATDGTPAPVRRPQTERSRSRDCEQQTDRDRDGREVVVSSSCTATWSITTRQ